jgi:hypothetical protein
MITDGLRAPTPGSPSAANPAQLRRAVIALRGIGIPDLVLSHAATVRHGSPRCPTISRLSRPSAGRAFGLRTGHQREPGRREHCRRPTRSRGGRLAGRRPSPRRCACMPQQRSTMGRRDGPRVKTPDSTTPTCVSAGGRCSKPGERLGGQGRGRTADLPIFSRTLVPTELPGRGARLMLPGCRADARRAGALRPTRETPHVVTRGVWRWRS